LSRPPLLASDSLSTSEGPRSRERATSAHQTVVEARELTLVGRRVDLAQKLGDGEPQHPVAQELEALVVAALGGGLAHAGMGERLLEEGAILEGVAEAALQLLELSDRGHDDA